MLLEAHIIGVKTNGIALDMLMDLLNFHSRIKIPEQRMHGIIKITC